MPVCWWSRTRSTRLVLTTGISWERWFYRLWWWLLVQRSDYWVRVGHGELLQTPRLIQDNSWTFPAITHTKDPLGYSSKFFEGVGGWGSAGTFSIWSSMQPSNALTNVPDNYLFSVSFKGRDPQSFATAKQSSSPTVGHKHWVYNI